jgi:hypothetical protein
MVVVLRVFMAMIFPFHVVLSRHDENAAANTDHLDGRSVEARQDRTGDDFVDGAECRVPVAEVENAIERSKQRVELVRAE